MLQLWFGGAIVILDRHFQRRIRPARAVFDCSWTRWRWEFPSSCDVQSGSTRSESRCQTMCGQNDISSVGNGGNGICTFFHHVSEGMNVPNGQQGEHGIGLGKKASISLPFYREVG